ISNSLDGVKLLIMDFEEVEYISSAGLRVLLIAQKTMNKQGDMKVNNVNTDIMEIFEVTGFSDILTIE
ncbi:MAG: STAS domain-containing protein, partial [Ruminococcus sp.]|nr:STAS domain-containing protein [Ruminococcus sp.]